MSDIVQLTTTVATKADAERLAERMVTEGLAACAHIVGPIESVFRWQGAMERATEWSCRFKTSKLRVHELRTRVVSAHPYEVPEVLVTPVSESHAAYAEWVERETRATGRPPEDR